MKRICKRVAHSILLLTLAVVFLFSLPITTYAASANGTLSTLTACNDGLSVSWKASNNAIGGVNGSKAAASGTSEITLTAASYSGLTTYKTTVTVTLTNNNSDGKTMNLEFAVSYSGSAPTVTAGSGVTTNSDESPYSFELDSGETVTVTLTSTSTTAITATLSNIQFYSNEDVTITFMPAENNQSGASTGTYTVNGTSVGSNGVVVGYSAITSIVPTPATGYKFAGWLTGNGTLLDYTAGTYLFTKPLENTTLYACFVPTDTAKFLVGSNYYFYWEDAFDAAVANSIATVVIAGDGKLLNTTAYNKTGDYVTADANGNITYKVPSGYKLLLPKSATDTSGSFGAPETASAGNSATAVPAPAIYRTLTVASGATIDCTGSINVNATQTVGGNLCFPGRCCGGYGYLVLESNSVLNLNYGANLYCYGYIGGDGTVTANSGANVYELLEIVDWRGGQVTLSMYNSENVDDFGFYQYYIQNILSHYRIYTGAKSYAYVGLTYALGTIQKEAEYIGSSGVFRLSGVSSYVERSYSSTTDRMKFEINGALEMGNMDIKVPVSSWGSQTLSTNNGVFYLQNNYDIVMNSGSDTTINDASFALNCGCTITIMEGATVTIGSGQELFIFAKSDWDEDASVIYQSRPIIEVSYHVPTKRGTRSWATTGDAQLIVNGDLIINGAVYCSASGKGLSGIGKITVNNVGTRTYIGQADQLGSEIENYLQTPVVSLAGNLAGRGELMSLSTGAYYGLGDDYDDYWYQYLVTVENAVPGIVSQSTPNAGTSTYTTVKRDGTDVANVIGYSVDGGAYTFNVAEGKTFIAQDGATVAYQYQQNGNSMTVSADTVLKQAVAEVVSSTPTYHTSLQNAVNTCGDTGYIQMLADSKNETDITATSDVYLNLNGKDVTVTGTFAMGGYTLYGMDSATDSLIDSEYGVISGKVSGTVKTVHDSAQGPNVGRLYVSCTDDEVLSFHRIKFGIDSYTYYTKGDGTLVDALTISATYKGDTQALKKMEDFGMAVSVGGTAINAGSEWDGTELEIIQETTGEETATTLLGYLLQGYATDVLSKTVSAEALLKIGSVEVSNAAVSIDMTNPGGT